MPIGHAPPYVLCPAYVQPPSWFRITGSVVVCLSKVGRSYLFTLYHGYFESYQKMERHRQINHGLR